MKLAVTHETIYHYQPVVETAQHMVYLTPRQDDTQQLLMHRIEISLAPSQRSCSVDVFGNTREFFRYRCRTANCPSWA